MMLKAFEHIADKTTARAQFKSTQQILDEWKKGIDTARSLFDLLSSFDTDEDGEEEN